MGKQSYLQNMGHKTPELHQGPFLTWDNENKPYNECATLERQKTLIGIAKDNPYGYATLEQCMHAVIPYLFLPIEEEKYFDELVTKLRDYQDKMYTYEKDETGKINFVKPTYSHHAMNQKLIELLQGHPLRQKYGHHMLEMVLSWKRSKSKENARNNVRKFLIPWAKERIWNNWKRYHREDIVHMTQKKISDVFAAPGALDIHTHRDDLQKYPPRPTSFTQQKKQKKTFDKTSLTSLFQRTGDGKLDTLLDHGREVVDSAEYPRMRVKPTHILLRKHDTSSEHDRPRQYVFMQYMHEAVKKYYDADGKLKPAYIHTPSIPSISEIYGDLIA